MAFLSRRQNFVDDPYNRSYSWWYDTTEGTIVKWSIFFGILFIFIALLLGGRAHAMKRINKGLPPLSYHRWMLSRRQRAMYDPRYQNPPVVYTVYPPQNGQYNMYAMPPPVYDPSSAPPPTYQPPPGASKVDPSQSRPGNAGGEAGQSFQPTQAPVQAQNTGASNNPYRL